MSIPPRLTDHRSPKRQRFPSVDEDDEEEDEDDDDEDSNASSVNEEEIREEEVGIAEVVSVTEAQSRRSVSSSPSSSSPQQSVNLKSSDVLDCPTCSEPLKKPIYQCTNGHLACSSCCQKLRKRCPFCRSHIGDIRCRAMEKVLEASVVPCRNAVYGCKETTSYGDQSSHENRCAFVRCFCPVPNCNYTGSHTGLRSHACSAHSRDADDLIPFVFDSPQLFSLNLGKKKITVFQEEKEGDLIVVQTFKGSHGVYMTVSCIAPMTPGSRNFSCSLAKLDAYTTLRLGLMVKKIQKVGELEEPPKDGFMLIPSYMLKGDYFKMQICFGREYKYVHI